MLSTALVLFFSSFNFFSIETLQTNNITQLTISNILTLFFKTLLLFLTFNKVSLQTHIRRFADLLYYNLLFYFNLSYLFCSDFLRNCIYEITQIFLSLISKITASYRYLILFLFFLSNYKHIWNSVKS